MKLIGEIKETTEDIEKKYSEGEEEYNKIFEWIFDRTTEQK